MKGIADANPDLAGALPQGYAGLPNDVVQELLRLLAPLKVEGDAYGLIFEYFMGKFAYSFMQKGGEYFTPASIVKLIVEVKEPYQPSSTRRAARADVRAFCRVRVARSILWAARLAQLHCAIQLQLADKPARGAVEGLLPPPTMLSSWHC